MVGTTIHILKVMYGTTIHILNECNQGRNAMYGTAIHILEFIIRIV